jgi:hypothetical protein
MYHKVGKFTEHRTRTSNFQSIVALRGLRVAARLTKKQATAASRSSAVPNPKRLTINCHRDIKLELDFE